MAFLFPRLALHRATSIGLGVTTSLTIYSLLPTSPIRPKLQYCDSLSSSSAATNWNYSQAQTPVVKNGKPNPAAYKQLSAGSILGLVGGVAVSMFSKTLAVLLGLAIFGVQVSQQDMKKKDNVEALGTSGDILC